MAKQLNINLGFTADISQAQANIQALKQSLNQISSIKPIAGGMLTKDMQIAVNSAKSLEQHLTNAFNTKTGNFDLSKLSLSLRQSGENLNGLSAGLLRAGENGERAFMNVQKALTTANVQINKSNGMLAQFANTLKNTARWQLSSSLLHGFISGLNQAISYSKDLDKSLNNIRIVTGYSAESMQDFARSANEAAKALSSTTNEYAKASLIYFQQGLGSDEVKERTDATIKMANVSGQSAEVVSDQMTAVWNNFDDGSKSLEYYADVMVKLGAETASSSDEIAGGLEKFAAVGKTIGLSYEYAAAALATITARTRQSEEVVGTALKTIFARIQGLKLGETLEDGVELNKYSEALQSVGISIFEQNGELKQMDSILNEMGAKWETLSKAQQVALAQTVAGVRQYTQLVALMDSWNDGQGSFQDNLQTAYDATGALDKQQRTYEESWQAASKRIRASLEGIWEDLIPSDSIIGITDMLAGLLNIVDRLIEGFGGLEGIIMLVATIAINKMGPSIANGIDLAIAKAQEFKQHLADQNMLSIGGIAQSIKSNFMNMFTPAATSAAQLRDNVQAIKYETNSLEKGMAFYNQHLKSGASATTQMLQNMNAEAAAQNNLSNSFKQYLADTTQINNLQAMIEANKKRMTQAELDSLSALQSAATVAAERKAIEQETLQLIELQIDRERMSIDSHLYDSANYNESENSSSLRVEEVSPLLNTASRYTNNQTGLDYWTEQINTQMQGLSGLQIQIRQLGEGVEIYGDSWRSVGEASATARDMVGNIYSLNLKLNAVMQQSNVPIEDRKKKMQEIIDKEIELGNITKGIGKRYAGMVNTLNNSTKAQSKFRTITNNIFNGAKSYAKTLMNSEKSIEKTVNIRKQEYDAQQKLNQTTSQHKNLIDQIANGLNKGLSGLSTWGGQISKTISGFSRLAMAANMVKNAIDTLNDPDADFTSKLVSSTMALSMGFSALMPVIQGLVSGLSAYNAIQGGLKATTVAYAGINKILADSEARKTLAIALGAAATKLGAEATEDEMAAELQSIIVDKLKISSEEAEVIAKGLAVAWSKKSKDATDAETVANWANFASQMARNWILLLVVAALALIAAATWTVVAAVKADNEEAKKNAKTMSELNEKTKELADSTQSLEGEIKSLIDTFNQQRAAGEDVSETYNELVKKLNEVKQNYKKLNVSDSTMDLLDQAEALGLATGNWEAYTKAQRQAQEEVKDEVGKQAEATTQANLAGAVAAFTDGQGDYEEDDAGKYVRRHVGNAGEDKEVSEILNKAEYAEIFKDINDDDATLRIDWDNESEFMEDYQLLANALRDMEIAGQTSNGTYKELKKEFNAMAEYAGEIEANMNAATEHKMSKKLDELGINAENINNLDEYTYTLETLTDEMTNFFTSSEEARKKAKAFLGTFGNTSESAAAYNFVEKFGNKMKTAIDYKIVGDSTTTNEKGQAYLDIQAKYNEEQIKQEVQAMFNYIQGLPEDMRKIALSIELEHIDSLEEFKTVFNKTKAFEAKVKIKADPQSVLDSAKQIRDDLSDAMEQFSDQGYLTTTQAIEFLDEFPQYSNYLIETANGYAFTEEAVNEFNGALKDEKEALSELISPTNIGAQALYDFGKELISLEAAVEGEGLKKFITDMQDLTTQFIEGKIKSDEYFTALNDNINNISFDENSSMNDIMAFGNEVVPSMIGGIDSYLGAIDAAFEKGQIGAIEYREALTQSANAVLKLEQKTRDAIKSTEKFSGIKFNEQTQQYERSAKWLGKVDQKTKDVVDSLNESLKRSKELEKVLKTMASFEGINVAATEDYEDLQKIFDEDFSIEIDDSELDAAIAKTQDYRDSIATAFAALDSEAQKAVIEKIGELGNKFDDTSGKAFNMSTQTNTALSSIGVKAGTVTNEVEQAAVDMLNGTYVATSENSQLTADAMGLILESGADTSQMVATMTGNVIQGIGDLVSNFDATIEIRSAGLGIGVEPFTFDILGKEFTINLPAPHFDIGFKGHLNGKAAKAFDSVIGNLQGLTTITSGKSAGGMSSFAPPTSLGDAGDVQLDEDPDGSGGSKSASKPATADTHKPTEQKKADDEIEKYYEVNKALEDLERTLKRVQDKKELAFGKAHLDIMEEENQVLREKIGLNNELISQADTNIQKYKADIEAAGGKIDPITGRIINYEEYLTNASNALNDFYASYDSQSQSLNNEEANWKNYYDSLGDKKTQSQADEQAAKEQNIKDAKTNLDISKEAAEQAYEDKKKALEEYEAAMKTYKDTIYENETLMRQIAANKVEALRNYVDNLQMIEDIRLDQVDFYLNRIGDNAYKSVEKMTKMFEIIDNGISGNSKIGSLINKMIYSYKGYNDVLWEYNNNLNNINFSHVVDQAAEDLPNIISAMNDLIEADKEMVEYYGESIREIDSDFQYHLELYDTGVNKLEHYKNLLGLINREQDYKSIGAVLNSQLKVSKQVVDSNKQYFDQVGAEYAKLKGAWEAAPDGSKQKEALEENMKAMLEIVNEAKENWLSSLEDLAEKANAILENNLAKLRKDLEKNLTGGPSLSDYITETERFNARQEEYLTNTNKLYETNKLIRQAQLNMDKTDNNRAKQKYKEYAKEIEQLQKQGQLSSYQLSIKQAEFELLQAQIALEEAQDAKNQVRLTRDAEGNYGYVYTANEDSIAEAEQQVADSENKLYNIGLDGAKEYQDKYNQTMQEALDAYDELAEKRRTGEIATDEEYNKKLLETKEHYTQLLQQYETLYYTGRNLMIQESFDKEGKEVLQAIGHAEDFDTYSTQYITHAKQSFVDFGSTVEVISNEVGKDYTTVTEKTNAVAEATGKVSKAIDDMMPKMENELKGLRDSAKEYAIKRDEIYLTIDAYDKLAKKLKALLEVQNITNDVIQLKDMVNEVNNNPDAYSQEWIEAVNESYQGKLKATDIADLIKQRLQAGPSTDADWQEIWKLLDIRKDKITDQQGNLKTGMISNEDLLAQLEKELGYNYFDTGATQEEIDAYQLEHSGDNKSSNTVSTTTISNSNGFSSAVGTSVSGGQRVDTPQVVPSVELKEHVVKKNENLSSIAKQHGTTVNDLMEKNPQIKDRNLIYPGQIIKYDTGGYTGAWGPEGKLAVLHEKELVLNAQDTENLLASTIILREISQMLDRNALLASLGMADFEALKLNETADQVLQQDVTIHAEFPNVTDHNEIELAIDNLINAASQHAYRQ